MRRARWRPDTCACVLDYEWDDQAPEAGRAHGLAQVITRCPDHAALPTDAAVWAACSEENPRKNRALAALLNAVPALGRDVVPDEGGGVRKEFAVPVTWRFDGDRVLYVQVALAAVDRAGAQAAVRAEVGPRVVLE